jgi:glucose-6-phosphate isomerase
VNNFFATFIEVLRDRDTASLEVDPGVTSGDYLHAFLQGTRSALYENGRESVTITLGKLDAQSVGALIALYERAVGLYAMLVNINAYHQPGVEAGKKMAGAVITLQSDVLQFLRKNIGAYTAEEVARALGAEDQAETVFKILDHAAANADHNVKKSPGKAFFEAKYAAG